jgi:hypothetical protein
MPFFFSGFLSFSFCFVLEPNELGFLRPALHASERILRMCGWMDGWVDIDGSGGGLAQRSRSRSRLGWLDSWVVLVVGARE